MLYNENDAFAASWLRELISAGELPEGHVDERSIEELGPGEIPATAHFFAGIGGWPYALELAGWPSDAPVWTGSCPCQPFSAAGRRGGHEDARHLWPVWFGLIEKCRPPVIFGEQVASGDGRRWLSGVRADLETLGYAVGCADLCAAGVGAPHIRQRLFWVADLSGAGRDTERGSGQAVFEPGAEQRPAGLCGAGGLGHAEGDGRTGSGERAERAGRDVSASGAGALGNFWAPFDLVPCQDGKARRVEPGTFPLATGVSARVGRLRGYGNAIVPQVAAEFIRAFMETANAS
jgi:DNA (cytosine-5)-methyltransferase 1